jgi:glutamate racemase
MDLPNFPSPPIGVFDSGLGGLTVVRELSATLPGESIVYLGDSARVPYGIKSLETVRQFALECTSFLLQFHPKLIVTACNTATAAAIDDIRAAVEVPVVDVIGPGSRAALAATDGPVGVIGTDATIDSGAYQRTIAELAPDRSVVAAACPLLVPIIEEGRPEDDPIVLNVLADYLRHLQRARVGALILGCTHYPLLARAIGKLMGPDVTLVSSAAAAAERARRELPDAPSAGDGQLHCYTTDNAERFARLGQRFGGREMDHVQYIGTDELQAKLT